MKITELWIGEPVNDNADVIVTLDDNSAYAFTAFTPQAILGEMTRENAGHFYVEDLLIVRDFQEATVRAAVEDIASRDNLARAGIRQID